MLSISLTPSTLTKISLSEFTAILETCYKNVTDYRNVKDYRHATNMLQTTEMLEALLIFPSLKFENKQNCFILFIVKYFSLIILL